MLVGMDPRKLVGNQDRNKSSLILLHVSKQIQTKSLTLSWELLSLLDDCFTAGLENGMLCNHRKAISSVIIPPWLFPEKSNLKN